ncbi:hypothetical protein KSP40_PGU016328 [Platanthera guangdongensis]|uniref:Uncharacterized protein n=1 Tax=Platanthera guangdongensis TaxID=2320717 RepID=A0ABR2LQG3_9ASPA
MSVGKEICLRYGRFFYRFDNGESAADVYDRITGFRETLKSDIDVGRFQPPGQQSPNMNLVIVSHVGAGTERTSRRGDDVCGSGGRRPGGSGSVECGRSAIGGPDGAIEGGRGTGQARMALGRDMEASPTIVFSGIYLGGRKQRESGMLLRETHLPSSVSIRPSNRIPAKCAQQRRANTGELNCDSSTTGPSFFTHFD